MDYTFYYDELTSFFNEPAPYLLMGGITHKKTEFPNNKNEKKINSLIEKLNEEFSNKAISNTFIELLNSPNLEKLLQSLLESEYFIHLHVSNLEYLALIDIIESWISYVNRDGEFTNLNSDSKGYSIYCDYYKDALYKLFKIDNTRFKKLITNHFHNKENKPIDLIINLYNLLINSLISTTNMDSFTITQLNSLTTLFKPCVSEIKNKSFFLPQQEPDLLMNNFNCFFIHQKKFKGSNYLYSNQCSAENSIFQQCTTQSSIQKNNTFFINTKSSFTPHFQLSNLISALFKKYITFIAQTQRAQMKLILLSFNDQQLKCTNLFKKIILKSNNENSFLIHFITPRSEQLIHKIFMAPDDFVL